MLIGILGIQGSREEHAEILKSLKVPCVYVRTAEELEKVDGIILPGGESTTIGMLIGRNSLDKALKKRLLQGLPAYGTCAGAILLAKEIAGEQKADNLKIMDIVISRNAYGAQLDSFITEIDVPVLGKAKLEAVFIRAPKIEKIGKNAEILAEYQGSPVLVKEGNIMVSTFHPELTDDQRVHKYFLKMVYESK